MIIASMVAAIGLDMVIARRLYHPVNRQMANRAGLFHSMKVGSGVYA